LGNAKKNNRKLGVVFTTTIEMSRFLTGILEQNYFVKNRAERLEKV